MSKIICNILIVLFILVGMAIAIVAVFYKHDWRFGLGGLALACAVLLMYQAVIYNGKKDKVLLEKIPWEKVTELAKKGNTVTVGSTTVVPPTVQGGQNGI